MVTSAASESATRRKIMWGGAGILALLLAGYTLAPDALRRSVGLTESPKTTASGLAVSETAPRGSGGLLGILRDIAERTPGIRIGGTALKGKTRFAGLGKGPANSSNTVPGRRPRGEVASAGPIPALPTFEQPIPAARPAIVLPDFPQLAQRPSAPGGGTIGGFPFPFPGGGYFPPTGGGGVVIPPSGPPTTNPPPPPPPPPGVPEPSVWLVLVLGFGVIGRSMRQQRRFSFA